VQLWVVLPDAVRDTAPAFEHHADLPGFTSDGLSATVLVGELAGARSAATTHTPLVGVDLELAPGADVELPLDPDFEFGLLASTGAAEVEGAPLGTGAMLYLGTGRRTLRLRGAPSADGAPTRLLLLGGEPFDERIVMWWNFVGRSGEEIADYAEQWNAESDRFGAVIGSDGNRLEAPPLPPVPLKARGRER
jgi:quercetin 2,3-dioxygenase